jgi:N-sulfoglucosamine sulfohydrolase
MRQASSEDQAIANRVQFFLYRVPEEFYHFQNDPDALHNLIDDPEHTEQIDNLRADLESWMQLTHDPALETFRNRYVRNALEEFINQTTIFLGNYE